MAQPTLKIILDWANEGSAPDTVDLSATTTQTQINRGRNIIQDLYDVGTASFRVIDPDGKWNPQNTSSPYYGKVTPLRKVSISGTWLTVDYPLFSGYTVTYNYTYPTDQEFGYVTIYCEDAFRLFNMANITTVTGGVAGQTTSARVSSILDQIGWSATKRDIDTGLSTCIADPGTTRTALEALRTVEFTEGLGAFYMAADGDATFRNRQNTIIGFAPRTTSTNWIKDPSFESGLQTWQASNATNYSIAKDDTNAYMGTSSLLVTCNSASATNGGLLTNRTPVGDNGRVPLTGGDIINASAYFKTITGTRQMGILIQYFATQTGTTQIGSSVLSTGISSSSSWQKASLTTTVPSGLGIAWANIGLIHRTTGSVGDSFCVDAVVVEKNYTTLSPYPFDGAISNFPTNYAANLSWTGTQYFSTSIASYLTYPNPTAFGQTPPQIPYQNIAFAFDDKLLVNQATFARVGGTPQTNTDATSVTKYFVHSINKSDLLMETDALALDLARAYVAGRQDTTIRIQNLALELNAVTSSSNVISIIDLDYFDKVIVSNNQPGGSNITQTLFVQGLSHDITPTRWITTIQTYESLLDGLILNDSVKGTLDYNVLGY
jgi:hypothetical protein